MAIPTITFPEFPLLTSFLGDLLEKVPFEIPTLLHPPLVHFAIALPIIIIILEVFNVFAKLTSTSQKPKGKTVSALSLFMIIVLFLVSIGAYATGVADATNAWDTLTVEAQTDVKAHKLLGAYIVLSSFVLLIFKFLSMIGTKSKVFFLILTIAFAGLSLQQGKEGGELVFAHGANVERVADISSDLEDAKDELSEAEEAQSSNMDTAKILSEAKKVLEEKVTLLDAEKANLLEEKVNLIKNITDIKVHSEKALEDAKTEAKEAIDKIREDSQSMIDDLREKASKTLDQAKDIATDVQEKLSKEEDTTYEADAVVQEVEVKEEVNTTSE
ncbi:MAG: hypothetical protein JJV88_04935 [Sulfurovum sp.]|nr:hypothetical protein [Sulfurovaceae bacterium]